MYYSLHAWYVCRHGMRTGLMNKAQLFLWKELLTVKSDVVPYVVPYVVPGAAHGQGHGFGYGLEARRSYSFGKGQQGYYKTILILISRLTVWYSS